MPESFGSARADHEYTSEEGSAIGSHRPRGSSIGDFLRFRSLVSSTVMTFIYFLGAAWLTLHGIGRILLPQSEYSAVFGVGIILLGNLVWRVLCEIIAVAFSIHDRLSEIEKHLRSASEA